MENKVTELDARGLECPAPVIETKKALESFTNGKLVTIVDNEVAKDNIIKFARNQALEFGVEEKGEDYYITISKTDLSCQIEKGPSGTVILISSNTLGRGDDQLGSTLMKSYLYALNESEPMPATILFINSGVKLPSEGSEVVEHLLNLEKQGVELLACGLCLDFFNLKEKLYVGQVTNMYTIIEKMNSATKVINL